MAVAAASVDCSYSDISVLLYSDVVVLQMCVCTCMCACVHVCMCLGVCAGGVVDSDSCIHMYICPCKCMFVIMSNYM